MVSNLYTIEDKQTENCIPLFQQTNNSAAIRHFNGYLRSMPHYMREDFTLYCVGTVDGKFIVGHEPVVVAVGTIEPLPGEKGASI